MREIAPWELLQKKMLWGQLEFVQNKRVLDFGSGNGISADYFAQGNEVIAIEPDEEILINRFQEHEYKQIQGGVQELKSFDDEFFDVILCHNVLEYAKEREEIIKEFSRVLKPGGHLSVIKHNRAGRVMQMVVLLNNFEHANELLEGMNGQAKQFGTIHYYDDLDILKWSDAFKIEKILGLRTFWDLQQNQEIQMEKEWQDTMLQIEKKVSDLEEYKAVAFFHHIIFKKS